MRRSLQFLRERVSNGLPLKIERSLHTNWIIFKDGACEQNALSGSVGGVLYDPRGNCINYFGEMLPQDLLDRLFLHSKNPTHELELLPVVIASML